MVAEVVGEASPGLFFFEAYLVLMASKECEGGDHDESAELREVHEISQVGARQKNKVEDEGAG